MTSESNLPESAVSQSVRLEAPHQEASPAPDSGAPLTLPSSSSSTTASEVQELLQQVVEWLSIDKLVTLFQQYRQPVIAVGLAIATVILLKVALAILGAINEVPLLEPTFEIVGLGYSAWFIYRYLLKAESRSELLARFNALKKQVLGER
ncbi:CAAD domain-containing protein [Synechococcus elongatus]|uniref:CAAD domain-containing protein n=1 Tax=Synechococcus elongatus TaxID=32046 RepID=UPI000F7DA5F9|nr:CAAD domain-containing protein [Synechococcus elongatus]